MRFIAKASETTKSLKKKIRTGSSGQTERETCKQSLAQP